MKKTLVAAILGIATVVSSFGQGHVFFNNYSTAAGQTTFGAGTAQTGGVTSTYHAALYYGLGTVTVAQDPVGTANPAVLGALGLLGGNTGLNPAYPTQYQVNNAGLGYFIGPAVTISDYVSGPITFMVVAYNGADYLSSTIRGHSAAFTMNSIATGQNPVGVFSGLTDFQVFSVPVVIPEPATFALAGLGAAALLLFRRRS